jgi:hypothetical protein
MDGSMSAGPRARQTRIVRRDLGDETLIYDLDTDRAHSLNPTAAGVWKRCDGASTPAEIACLVSADLGTTVDEQTVWYALHELARKDLLAETGLPVGVSPITRRQLVRRAGLVAAAVAIPAVTSIVVPTAAQAASCVHAGGSCVISAQCCSNNCTGSVCVGG